MDLQTTVRITGLATSFSKGDFVYLVSTIHRKELGDFYQTSVLKYSLSSWEAGPHRAEQQMVYRIEVMSQLQSAQEHVDTVMMALSEDEDDWEGTKVYQDEVMDALSSSDRQNDRQQEMRWTDKRIRDVVSVADINYKHGLFARIFSS
jgi:hypothetical protein